MNMIGTRDLETERLILKVPTMKEQKRLWEILIIPEVNKYYLAVPSKFQEKIMSWVKQEPFYEDKVNHAHENNKYVWSIFLKSTGECIGQIDAHDASDCDFDEKDVGWYIDPNNQGKGYGTEAAKAMLDYLFINVKLSAIKTGAAIINPPSWKIMEHFGFLRSEKTSYVNYTFVAEPVEIYSYSITREEYFKYNNL